MSRPQAIVILILVVAGGALRIWSAIAFPALDQYDRTPLLGALIGGIVGVATGALIFGAPRVLGGVIGCVAGVSLGYGGYLVANALLDRSPTQYVSYTVAGHFHGRRSTLSLVRAGGDGPAALWLAETRATLPMPVGTPVVIPVRHGAFETPWRAGPLR